MFDAPGAILFGIGIGLVLGMINGFIVTVLRVPAIVATLGTLSIFRGVDYLIAGSHQVPLAGLPPGFTDAAHDDILGIPIFVLIAVVVVVDRDGRAALDRSSGGSSTRSAATRRRRPSSASRRGWSCSSAFALCGLLAGVAGVMYVIEFGTINGTSAGGYTLQVIAAVVVVGGVGIFGGTGTLAGAALGALFLGFIANALILIGLSQFWLQAIYGLVILVAVSADAVILRRLQRATSIEPQPMSAAVAPATSAAVVDPRGLARWETLLLVALLGLIVLGNALSPFFLTTGNFGNLIAALMEVAIMALPMTLIIIAGEIDLSVESMAGSRERDPRLPLGGRRPDGGRHPGRARRRAPSAAC